MKSTTGRLVAAVCLSSVLLVGCATRHREHVVVAPTGAVVVASEPPAPRHEAIPVAPGESAVWIPGYWTYQNTRWVWVAGHYEARPHPGAAWVPGHWDHTHHGWVWSPGHWD